MLGFNLSKIINHNRFANDFEDLGVIGNGGFSEVHHVRHKLDEKQYALKIISVKPSSSEEQTEQRVHRLLSEARIHSQLNSSFIIDYHGCWMELEQFQQEENRESESQLEEQFEMIIVEDDTDSDGICFGSISEQEKKAAEKTWQKPSKNSRDQRLLTNYKTIYLYFLTQICEQSLQSYLYARNKCKKTNQKQDWAQNCLLALDITKGLSYMHSHNIIHRDIKPHNIVLKNGKCKLIDFGIARKMKQPNNFNQQLMPIGIQDSSSMSSCVGTKLFSSPEQATSQKYDYRTDIFSLALVLVLLFCSFNTQHQQKDLIQAIRLRQFDGILMPSRLKDVLYRSLGPENQRPVLSEIQIVLREQLLSLKRSHQVSPLVERQQNRQQSIFEKIHLKSSQILAT